jgi:8-oxo-dGTP diphosphatase
MTGTAEHLIVVTAAVIEREGRFLLTTRPEGTHLSGYWEFPGGKCEGDETPEQCLKRELREELDVQADVAGEMFRTRYRYPGRFLELRFFRCRLEGDPRPMQGQAMRWVKRDELGALKFPPADEEFIKRLRAGG